MQRSSVQIHPKLHDPAEKHRYRVPLLHPHLYLLFGIILGSESNTSSDTQVLNGKIDIANEKQS